ncbi:MAG TPA: DUF1295 domain-containing protein [Solirubrobacteraceae bacterium]|nr:DUF1295 domain-containing protein [Solirubrobacteraceae bacterium]
MSIFTETTERSLRRTRASLFANAASLDLPLLAVLAAFVAEPSTRSFALVNLLVQTVLFVVVAFLPAYRTRVMAFVDLAWPWGLVAIGVQTALFGHASSAVLLIVAGIYVVMGLRMAARGIVLFTKSFPHDDLPRYRYRRLLWQHDGYRSETVPMLHEILQQTLSNASTLAAPAMLMVAYPHAGVGPVVVAGLLLWAISWALESVADMQKARFVRRSGSAGATRTCDVGLWGYSRHPNYFFQWLQWHGLILIALPSLIHLAGNIALLPWVGFAAGLLSISAGFYYALVHYTGAIPAEHFSVQHRPDYRDYQQRVNRFFPGTHRGDDR